MVLNILSFYSEERLVLNIGHKREDKKLTEVTSSAVYVIPVLFFFGLELVKLQAAGLLEIEAAGRAEG